MHRPFFQCRGAALEVFVKTGAFCRPTPRPSPIWPSIGHLPLPGKPMTRPKPEAFARALHFRSIQVPSPGPKVSPSSAALPRIIWMFWAQGAASLGPFRRACISSWQCQNPTWEVVLLDKQSCPLACLQHGKGLGVFYRDAAHGMYGNGSTQPPRIHRRGRNGNTH